MDFERTLKTHILECSENFPVVLVTGARQVGKTTLLRSLCEPHRRYISLDDPLALALAKEDPALFLERNPPPLLIDEVQYAPELLTHIKIRVDAQGGALGKAAYWLTGSQPFHLMRGVAESLAGRVAVITMLGLSRQEMIGQGAALIPPFVPTASVLQARQVLHQSAPWTHDQLFAHIWRGSFPALARNARLNRDVFYSSYLQTYIQRDVRALAQVGSEVVFTRFVRAAAARTAQLLNIADLARDTDIHPATAKQWLSILQASGIVHLLQPWHSNTTKRLVKTPKLYFLDTGLCSYLTQWSSPQTLEAGAMSGAIFETWVITEILKSYWHTGRTPVCSFLRTKDQYEVDLLIEQDGMIYLIECKKSASPSRHNLQGINALHQLQTNAADAAVVCLVPNATALSSRIQAVPIGYL